MPRPKRDAKQKGIGGDVAGSALDKQVIDGDSLTIG